jgi:choline dehydrogenase-like flavoprotein
VSFIDARTLEQPCSVDTDICIVGAGAAGLTLATQVARFSRDVCVIEGGDLAPDPEVQQLHDIESTGYPLRPDYMSRARCYGGTCNLWAGRNMLLSPDDLQTRDWVPHSGWPIPYTELAAFYPGAARELGLPALDSTPPEWLNRRMSAMERQLFARREFVPTLSLWAKRPMRFGARHARELKASAVVRVFLNASVLKLTTDDTGSAVSALAAATIDGKRLTIRARTFVLACGGLENARLLLVSNDRHASGIGNDRDLVGRYFMDHPRAVHGVLHAGPDCRFPLLRGRPMAGGKLQLGIGLNGEVQRAEGLLNHYVTFESQTSSYTQAKYQSFIQTMKVVLRRGYAGSRFDLARRHVQDLPNMIYLLSPKELMPHLVYRWYVAAREALPHRRKPRSYVVVYFCEQPPDPESRVCLSTQRDRFGMNMIRLHWHINESVYRTVTRLQSRLREGVEGARIGRLEEAIEKPVFTDASHHMGTTRMSAGPATGVVDTNGKVYGVANLYVAGSSVFPCAGFANPTITIVALALRLGAHLRDRAP